MAFNKDEETVKVAFQMGATAVNKEAVRNKLEKRIKGVVFRGKSICVQFTGPGFEFNHTAIFHTDDYVNCEKVANSAKAVMASVMASMYDLLI